MKKRTFPASNPSGVRPPPKRDALCPIRGERCLAGTCAWYTSGGCAMAVQAMQASRQANELYAVAEIMSGGHVEPAGMPTPDGEGVKEGDGS